MLKAPFPYFGGKSSVAPLVWQRLGDAPNYVEPFFGGGAVLLARPHYDVAAGRFTGKGWRTETVNDASAYLVNFWRAVTADPEQVAKLADWPVSEIDLHARHTWLTQGPKSAEFRERLRSDPDYYDCQFAAWWVWGACQWIGSGWCGDAQNSRQLPHLADSGRGIFAPGQANGDRLAYMLVGFGQLRQRLSQVRMTCGDWRRVCTPAVTHGGWETALFLDPPYSAEGGRDQNLYAEDSLTVAADVRDWLHETIVDGEYTGPRYCHPRLRIAYCGYEGIEMGEGWECVAWKANGGYGNQSQNANRHRECIWFSPACLRPAAQPAQISWL